MKYRLMTRAGVSVSQFGIGCMRLPQTPDKKIDEAQAIAMIRHGIDSGVNYIDTAYGYHNGESEVLVGKALQDGYRDKTFVATKSPLWHIKKPEDFERILDEQLTRLQTDHIDFYLFHSVHAESFQMMQRFRLLDAMERAVQAGKVRFPAFSFHDSVSVFKEIIDSYDKWTFAQIMLSYVDEKTQAGIEGMNYAYQKGVDIVVMEPLRGGLLANSVPETVQSIFDASPTRYEPFEWAMAWVYDHEAVKVALSGVSNMEQLEGQLRIADKAVAGGLTAEQRQTLQKAALAFKASFGVPCTACRYCEENCPNEIAIADIFAMYNRYKTYDDVEAVRANYPPLVQAKRDAASCAKCGTCETRCPQHIDIMKRLEGIHKEYAEVL